MKKICLSLGAALVAVSGFASTRILYQQNFETVPSAEDAGWSYNGGSMTIASDEYGKFLELALGQNNGRSGQVTWGQEIFLDENGQPILEDGLYTVGFDFSIKTNSNNQYNSEITLFTNHAPIQNQTYRLPWDEKNLGPWNTYVFDLAQCNTAADADMLATINAPLTETVGEDGAVTYAIDTAESYNLATGDWYQVICNVDVNNRVVEYSVESISGEILTSGEINVPEFNMNGDETPVSMLAEGLYVMMARYQTTIDIDNILVSCETSYPYANVPTVALTGLGTIFDEEAGEDVVNLNARSYTITFLDGETLNVQGTDGNVETVEWADCDGAYKYVTTTSGVLKAWTSTEGVDSEVVEVEVDCVPCVLPAATATISSVTAGYGKTYTLSVSNSDVPMQPTIFMNYEFKGVNGETLSEEGVASGAKVNVTEEGVLTITTQAFGYQASTVKIDNNLEFEVKSDYDFARLTREELTAAGFTDWKELNSSSTSGFNNWTARKRLYYNLAGSESVNEEGETVFTAVYPFGYVSEEGPVLNYSEIGVEGDDLGINVAGYELFPGITVYAGHNVTVLEHIGMINNSTTGGNNKNIDVLNLAATDFVVINRINNYGGNSNHPEVADDAAYYAVLAGEDEVYSVAESGVLNEETGVYTVSVPVYRIDTAATRLTVYAQKGGNGVEAIGAAVENNDPWYYTIDGLRVAEPTRPGLYIHQGKKIIVKK